MARIGYVGLGVMGGGVARRLLAAGHEVTGYNRTRSKAEPLIAAGMRFAETPREVAEHERRHLLDGDEHAGSRRPSPRAPTAILAGLAPGQGLRRHEHRQPGGQPRRSPSACASAAPRCSTRRCRAA